MKFLAKTLSIGSVMALLATSSFTPERVEEITGDFTTQAPAGGESWAREPDGSVVVDGIAVLRTLNRKLGTHFPLDGPKTLNGLIVEKLGEIPDAGTKVARSQGRFTGCWTIPSWAESPDWPGN